MDPGIKESFMERWNRYFPAVDLPVVKYDEERAEIDSNNILDCGVVTLL